MTEGNGIQANEESDEELQQRANALSLECRAVNWTEIKQLQLELVSGTILNNEANDLFISLRFGP